MYKKIICYIDTLQYGGAERVMSNLCNWFSSVGKDVVLINDISPSSVLPEYELDPNVNRYFLDDEIGEQAASNCKRIKCLRKIIKKEKPDVVLSFLGPPNLRMLFATIGLSVKKVVSVRNDPNKEYGTCIKKYISKIIFSLADGYVFQTDDAASYFGNRIRNKGQIIFNPVGKVFYDQEKLTPRNNIVVIGRLQAQKNPFLVIKAFSLIANRYPNYVLEFYGDGELKDGLIELSKELGINSRVYFKGQVSNIAEILASASLFILPSNYEGLPNALMEAMTVGVPVIACDCPCGGPRMLIQNTNQGLLVPCDDEEKMATAINRVLGDKELESIMRTEEQKRAKDFSREVVFKQWDEYLSFVVEEKNND